MATSDSTSWEWTGKRFRYIGGTRLGGRRHTVYASPRMVVEFELDRRGIARVAVSPPMADTVRSVVTQRALPFAIQNSPRGDTLEYVSSWDAVNTQTVIAGMRRAACLLLNRSGHAAAVEWVSKRGYGHGYGVLRRTLAHLNATSPQGIARAARKAKFDPGLHPRGDRGRFISARAGQAARDQMQQKVRTDAARRAQGR